MSEPTPGEPGPWGAPGTPYPQSGPWGAPGASPPPAGTPYGPPQPGAPTGPQPVPAPGAPGAPAGPWAASAGPWGAAPQATPWGAPPPGGWQQAARRPGIVPLRPLAFNEILDGAFQALRTNPRTMIGMGAAVLGIGAVLTVPAQAWLQWSVGTSANRAIEEGDPSGAIAAGLGSVAAVLPSALVQVVATLVLQALLVVAVHAAALGRRTSPGELWRRARGRIPAIIGLTLTVSIGTTLAAGVATAVFAVPGVLLIVSDRVVWGAVLFVPAVVALICSGVFLYVRLALAAPALLLENVGVATAIRRSWALTRAGFWRLLGILLVTGIMSAIVSGLLTTPFSIVGGIVDVVADNALHTKFLPTLASSTLSSVGQVVGSAVVIPWSAAVSALLYLDARMRREGLDLELDPAATPAP